MNESLFLLSSLPSSLYTPGSNLHSTECTLVVYVVFYPLLCAPCWTYLRGIRLYGSQVILQGQAAIVVEYGLYSDKMSLHEPLPLTSDLLLQRLQHRLEVLSEE